MTSKRGYAPKGYKAALDVEFDDLGNFKEEELKVVKKENILETCERHLLAFDSIKIVKENIGH